MAFDHSKNKLRRLYFIHGDTPTDEQLEKYGETHAFRNVDAHQKNDTLEPAAEVAGAWPVEYKAYNADAETKGNPLVKLVGDGRDGESANAPKKASKTPAK